MRKKKPAKKQSGKKKSAVRPKKSVKRRKPTRSKASDKSAQIHQGVADPEGEPKPTAKIPDDAAEYGGES